MPETECEFCGKKFKTAQALASHKKYAHKDEMGGGGVPDFDLKREMMDILHEVGLGRGRKLVTDTFFEIMSGDAKADLKQLDRLLAMTAVAKPLRDLVVMRWGQRIGSPIKLESERTPEPEAQPKHEPEPRVERAPEREEEIHCPCVFPMLSMITDPHSGKRVLFCSIKEKICPFYRLAFIGNCSWCGASIDVSNLEMGANFTCKRCGAKLVRSFEGEPRVVKAYTPMTLQQTSIF